jgi:hypothetical protein
LVTHNTAEVTKYARLISKYHTARKINSDFKDDSNLSLIRMNMHNLRNFRNFELLNPYRERVADIYRQEIDESKVVAEQYGTLMIESLSDKEFAGSADYAVPWIPGQAEDDWPIKIGYYTDNDGLWYHITDKATIMNLAKNHARKMGFNFETGAWWALKRKVGEEELLKAAFLELGYIVTWEGEPVKDGQEVPSDQTPPDKEIYVELIDFDEDYFLSISASDDDADDLQALGFGQEVSYWWNYVKSKAMAIQVIERIEKKGTTISDRDGLMADIQTTKIVKAASETPAKKFQKRRKKKSQPGQLELDFATISGEAYLIAWANEHNRDLGILRSLGFKKESPQYWFWIRNAGGLRGILKKMDAAGYKIDGFKALTKACKAYFGVNIKPMISPVGATAQTKTANGVQARMIAVIMVDDIDLGFEQVMKHVEA